METWQVIWEKLVLSTVFQWNWLELHYKTKSLYDVLVVHLIPDLVPRCCYNNLYGEAFPLD